MAQILSSFSRDANGVPIWTNGITVSKSMTLAGGTTNDPGDYDGTGNPATLFTVTGDVLVRIFAVCSVNLAGASATIEVGITGNTAGLIAQTTATDIDAGTVWIDTAPATVESLPAQQIMTNGTDIIQTVATANITAGALTYYCLWTPLSSDGNVVSA
jgi:hypothetical protein